MEPTIDELSQRRQDLQRRLRQLASQPGARALPPAPTAEALDLDFHRLFEQHHAVMFLVEAESLRLLDANQSCLNFYGYSR